MPTNLGSLSRFPNKPLLNLKVKSDPISSLVSKLIKPNFNSKLLLSLSDNFIFLPLNKLSLVLNWNSDAENVFLNLSFRMVSFFVSKTAIFFYRLYH